VILKEMINVCEMGLISNTSKEIIGLMVSDVLVYGICMQQLFEGEVKKVKVQTVCSVG
jgi:hypothetical protein